VQKGRISDIGGRPIRNRLLPLPGLLIVSHEMMRWTAS
jgi:hypothetical protein